MGSPVSVVVAEIVMQHVEERTLATCRQTIPLWLGYVDDTFTAVHKDEIDDFQDHLNEPNAEIQFTKEIEENEKLYFLDCLVSRENNELRITLVPEAFFYSFLTNFATRTASFIFFYWHEALRAEKRKSLVKTVGILIFMPKLLTVVSD